MSKIEVLANMLRQKITDFLIPIQTTKLINEADFDEIKQVLERIASQLKGEDLVSKSFLNEVHATIKILRAEAPYFSHDESARLEHMADELEFIFELILINETSDQRKPGVPRIL